MLLWVVLEIKTCWQATQIMEIERDIDEGLIDDKLEYEY